MLAIEEREYRMAITGHIEAADPAEQAKSQDGTITFPDWYRHDFRPKAAGSANFSGPSQ